MIFNSRSNLSKEQESLLLALEKNGTLSVWQKDIIITEYGKTGKSLEVLLVDLGFVEEKALAIVLSEIRHCLFVSLKDLSFSQTLLDRIPKDFCYRYCLIPFSYCTESKALTVAMADVSDIEAYDFLRNFLKEGESLITVSALKSEILDQLQMGKNSVSDALKLLSSSSYLKVDDHIISEFLQHLLCNAVLEKASDIHFEPEKVFLRIRYRCDGLLKEVISFHESIWSSLCIQIKILAKMDITETKKSQDGHFSLRILEKFIDFRVSVHPTIYGENIVLRVLNKHQSLISLTNLGYNAENLQCIENLAKVPDGLIIITGPTGSGKTTSLYSMLTLLDLSRLNVMTLEEPVEYHLSHVRQTEIREEGGLSFSSGIRSILRQDPDVILLGEMRDSETAHMALRAAMTGHKVLTTLHTNNGLAVLNRLVDFQIPFSMVTGLIRGIIAQRLVRILCPFCKKEKSLSEKEAKALKLWPCSSLYGPQGCQACDFQGYKGRRVISEVILMDDLLEEMILTQQPVSDLKKHLNQKGFKSLLEDGLQAISTGETSLEEVRRVVG